MPPTAAAPPAATDATAESTAERRRSLVDELEGVLAHADGKAIRVADIADHLDHRGPAVVALLLSLPFLIPMPPGLSTPLGAAICVYGWRLMLRLEPWLPGFIGNRTLSYPTLQRLIGFVSRTGRRVERLLKPRLNFMLWPAVDVPIGLSILFCGFFLSLPLPIPGSNVAPAIPLVLLLLGVIERDGVFILLGEIVSLALLAATAYVSFLMYKYGIKEGWKMVTN